MQRSAREVSKGIRVLIVDSTEMWRTGICLSMLDQADLTVVGDFDSAEAALAQLEQLSPWSAPICPTVPVTTPVFGLETCRRRPG